jgi:hypothetical protein
VSSNELQMEKVVPIDSPRGGSRFDVEELRVLYDEAAEFLRGFSWCRRIEEGFAGICVPGLVGVFLFRFEPAGNDVDPWVWVITGDVPPAYVTTENAPNPACALDGYIGAMQSWVRAVREGRPVSGEIPVNAPATPPYADMLEARLTLLDGEVLPRYRADLLESRRRS